MCLLICKLFIQTSFAILSIVTLLNCSIVFFVLSVGQWNSGAIFK